MANVVVILANPAAKRGEAAVRRVVAKLENAFAARGDEVRACFTERDGPREAEIVRDQAADATTIVAVGGDGTVRATALAMSDEQRARTTVGFVPMGNANVLAREVGIAHTDEDRAVAQVLAGTPRPMDIALVNGKPTFLLMLDVGYFAYVVHKVDGLRGTAATRWLYSIFGDVLYTLIGLVKFALPSPRVRVTVDDQQPFQASSVAIANARIYAKNGSFCPAADPSDGILDFNAAKPGKTIGYAFAAVSAKPKTKLSHMGRGETFRLQATSRWFLAQVDGDPLGDGPVAELTIEIAKSYYRLITPNA